MLTGRRVVVKRLFRPLRPYSIAVAPPMAGPAGFERIVALAAPAALDGIALLVPVVVHFVVVPADPLKADLANMVVTLEHGKAQGGVVGAREDHATVFEGTDHCRREFSGHPGSPHLSHFVSSQ